jgi:uncharacterized membrane protein YedE/YeeE
MQDFTPISALIGGALIGVSTVILMWVNGRIAGISGIFHGLFQYRPHDFWWRVLFIMGLVIGAQTYHFFPSIAFTPRSNYPAILLILAGILVGIGTKFSGGCTSGHGICGIARLSWRSILATIIFMAFAMITVYVMKHILGVTSL